MWKISDVRCRRGSLAFASLMRSTGSWQPRARPLFKSAERLAARQVRIDSPPTPNGQSGRKQICSPLQYLGNYVAIERPGLGVFGPGVETNFDKSPRQVFGYPEPVAGHEEECRRI
jgi:hypothetical protein